MPELFNSNRIKSPKGKQKLFVSKCQEKLGLKNGELAKLLKVSVRTLMDWRREKYLMPLEKARVLSKEAKVPMPKNAQILKEFWYTTKGAKKGGYASYKKQGVIGGNPEERKRKWREWWDREGKFKKHPIINVSLPVKNPPLSVELAEFVGIMMGDGGISKRQVTITLHSIDDKEYKSFVLKLIKKLFGITASVYKDKKFLANDIVVSRTNLVNFCKAIGLPLGNKIKQNLDMPKWIKNERQYFIACIRGLMDTDGSVFSHRYRVGGKLYSYKKLAFTSGSPALVKSVYEILRVIGLKPRLAQRGRDVRLDSITNVKNYFTLVGSNNPKHLRRYAMRRYAK